MAVGFTKLHKEATEIHKEKILYLIKCFFLMKQIMAERKDKYIAKYGLYPEFKAGIHRGKVIVTWVGEMKKEIVYIGDVLNTCSRIQEHCKRLNRDCLISEDILTQIGSLGKVKATFADAPVLRGKETPVNIYSLEPTD